MSKKVLKKKKEIPQIGKKRNVWTEMLEDLNAEITANPTLTEEDKCYLLEIDANLPEDEWEPITCTGESLSQLVINHRGER